ncbi:hypothetical protein P0W64_09005 [Tsukamurella sp. 8F]|uniref:Rv1476 family membrane protein n=1 Tax=unclassified Tsukamurella TaxID=2633480 RepID=UPI0023B9DDFA|nr:MULTISPECIES: DUF6676 family protein [unclassified Tsukamurella]MDF0529254.1 hypothetical protein [Tsukamurella sp. 8J]MDF0586909.1 hypothetical protein [Tsukamurella sp. 8F]
MGHMPIFTAVPNDVDLHALEAQLQATGVAVLNPDYQADVPALEKVVREAEAKGVQNFKIIVLAHDYFPDTSLRDLGRTVSDDMGGTMTVLTMSPHMVAGQSNQLSRFQIEKGQDGRGKTDKLQLGNPPAAASMFVDVAVGATTPWTAITYTLILVAVLGAAVGRVVTRRRSRAVHAARRAAGLVDARIAPGSAAATAGGGPGPDVADDDPKA